MTESDFLKLQNLSIQDTLITEDNIREKVLQAPSLKTRYRVLHLKESRLLFKLKQERNTIYVELMKYYKHKFPHPTTGEDSYAAAINNKFELDSLIDSESEFKEIDTKYTEQERVVTYIKDHIITLENLSYIFKNFIDLEKLRLGKFE